MTPNPNTVYVKLSIIKKNADAIAASAGALTSIERHYRVGQRCDEEDEERLGKTQQGKERRLGDEEQPLHGGEEEEREE